MKKCNPSHGQNGQLVHWWVLAHASPLGALTRHEKGIRSFVLELVSMLGDAMMGVAKVL